MSKQDLGITRFMDMHSGGRAKIRRNGIDQDCIYIEAPEKLGVAIFKEMYDREPDNITCQCCGSDYSVSFSDDLAQATGYDRGCDWDDEKHGYIEKARFSNYQTLEQYLNKPSVTFVSWDEAKKIFGIP